MTQVDIANFLSIIEITGFVFLFFFGVLCLYFLNSFIAKYKVIFRLQSFILIVSKLLSKQSLTIININSCWFKLLS